MTGTLISSVHPPIVPLSLEPSSDSEPSLETVAFVKPTNTDMNNKIHKQNNYTNLFLNTIGDQLIRIEEQVTQVKEEIKTLQPKETKEEEISLSNIRPPIPITGFNLSNPSKYLF